MPDREKVIKGLECCKIPFTKCYDGGCPYFENDGCKARLKGDALALLKAQEPVVPVKVNRYMETDENGDWFTTETYDCGNCGVELHGKANYCHLCGRAVKWEFSGANL